MLKLKKLFKASPVAVVVIGLLVAGVVSAALLGIYATATGTATVEQSVVFCDGKTTQDYSFIVTGGDTEIQASCLENKSDSTAPIKIVTINEAGVNTSYWSTVELTRKNTSTWEPIAGASATLTYELVANEFNYELEATGLVIDTEYSLIYYADKPDRFVDWGGNNPGALIVAGTADGSGNLSLIGSNNLAMNLPQSADWNGSVDADYCASDSYALCSGAKIWLIPSTEYTEGTKTVSWSDPTSYLFETDMITYDDLDSDGEALYLGSGKLNFFIKNIFAINATPGTYTIITKVKPVQ